MGGLPYTLQQQRILEERGWDRVSPHWLPNTLVDTSTSHVATLLGARGINYSTESACATGTHAVGEAAAAIARDQADVVLAGRDRVVDGADHPRRASARCARSSTAATTRRAPRGPSTRPAPAS